MIFYLILVLAVVGLKFLNDYVVLKAQDKRLKLASGEANEQINQKKSFWAGLEKFLFNDAGIVLIILALVLCLRRDTVGSDLSNYKDYYLAFANGEATLSNQYFNYEYGYAIINYIFAKIGLPFNFVFIVGDILFLVAFWLLVKKFSPDIYLSFILMMCLGLFEFSFSGLRQLYAIAFILFGLFFLFKKKVWAYYIFAFVAVFFHSSALFALIFPIFYYARFRAWMIGAITGVAAICCIFLKDICWLLGKIIGTDYFKNYAGVLTFSPSAFDIIWIVGFLALFILMFIFQKKLKQEDTQNRVMQVFLVMLFLSVLLKLCGIITDFAIIQRLVNYCFLSVFFLIPMFLQNWPEIKYKNLNVKLLLWCLISVVSLTYFALKLGLFDSCSIIPYQTILF